jgi:hypothetical protein
MRKTKLHETPPAAAGADGVDAPLSRSRRQFLGFSATGAAGALIGCGGESADNSGQTVDTAAPTGTTADTGTTPGTQSTPATGGSTPAPTGTPTGAAPMPTGATGPTGAGGPATTTSAPGSTGTTAAPTTTPSSPAPQGGSAPTANPGPTGAGGSTGGTPESAGAAGEGTGGRIEMGGGGNDGTGGAPPSVSVDGWKENNAEGCTMTGTPLTFDQSVDNPMLPDPFSYMDGSRISDKGQWECLRAELSAILQACIYGPKMPPPDTLDSTYSGGNLTINMTVGGKSGSFMVSINGGGSESNPVPCLITCGMSSLPALQGVAKIDMPNNTISQESQTVGSGGLVNDLYGNAASKSGSCIGWAWGLSRIIDALEQHPEAGIDVKRIAVTGCSRWGKGALAMGAFDERVALTLPEESGSGGTACWKVAAKEYSMGQNIQEAGEIVGEANWMGADFAQYANPRSNNNRLQGDMNLTVALCAPRAILTIDNDIDWLGPVASYAGGAAARPVWEALGIADRIGVSVAPNHGHCSFPQNQQAALDAFVQRFLLGMNADTSGVDDLNVSGTTSKLQTFNPGDWMDWDTPTLSGSLSWDPFA